MKARRIALPSCAADMLTCLSADEFGAGDVDENIGCIMYIRALTRERGRERERVRVHTGADEATARTLERRGSADMPPENADAGRACS